MPHYENDEQRQAAKKISQKNRDSRYERKSISPEKKLSKYLSIPFIAHDGEGVTLPGHYPIQRPHPKAHSKQRRYDLHGYYEKQDYCLLASSDGSYAVNTNLGGLSTGECFSHLLACSKRNPGAIHIAFFMRYDIEMWLKDVPIEEIDKLRKDDAGYYSWQDSITHERRHVGFKFEGPRTFQIWEYPLRSIRGVKQKTIGSIKIFDINGFFVEKAFKNVIAQNLGEDYALLKIIEPGKDERGTFKREEMETYVLAYCRSELTAMVELMQQFREKLAYHDDRWEGIQLARWNGAGAISTFLLNKFKVKEHMSRDIPTEIIHASAHAFAGGRIEAIRIGNGKDIHHADINSAYPDRQRYCPSLKDASWLHIDRVKTEEGFRALLAARPFSLFRLEWSFPRMWFYPFFYRNKKHAISYPRRGHNWLWSPEILAALDSIPDCFSYLTIHEGYACIPATDYRPFAWMEELYAIRQEWCNATPKIAAEICLKIGLASTYGKTAQRVGYNVRQVAQEEKKAQELGKPFDWKKSMPPFHQLEWAGYLTSGVRGKLFKAAMQAPHTIVSFATDGIFSLEKLAIDYSNTKELGKWEYQHHLEMTIVQPGVYWLLNAPDRKHSQVWLDAKYRGFDRKSLTREAILEAWKTHKHTEAYIEVPSVRFQTFTACAPQDIRGYNNTLIKQEPSRMEQWRTWLHMPRVLDISGNSGKRRPVLDEKRNLTQFRHHLIETVEGGTGLLQTIDREHFAEMELQPSAPHTELSEATELPWQARYDSLREDGIPMEEYHECLQLYEQEHET